MYTNIYITSTTFRRLDNVFLCSKMKIVFNGYSTCYTVVDKITKNEKKIIIIFEN